MQSFRNSIPILIWIDLVCKLRFVPTGEHWKGKPLLMGVLTEQITAPSLRQSPYRGRPNHSPPAWHWPGAELQQMWFMAQTFGFPSYLDVTAADWPQKQKYNYLSTGHGRGSPGKAWARNLFCIVFLQLFNCISQKYLGLYNSGETEQWGKETVCQHWYCLISYNSIGF